MRGKRGDPATSAYKSGAKNIVLPVSEGAGLQAEKHRSALACRLRSAGPRYAQVPVRRQVLSRHSVPHGGMT